ncbi:hypothetical protein [Bifidobacterium sp.]|uniref:hypothetical protein n=1 Tax=Bifidobacterium sp. TaxID=41200 RepID=UPI003D7CD1FF
MHNGGGTFSPEEVEYLRSLPVVAEATSKRITYTESFKHNCMRRYLAGESPVELFREAGLDPSLIGYKRIERCFARWRAIPCRMHTDKLVPVDGRAMDNGSVPDDGRAMNESRAERGGYTADDAHTAGDGRASYDGHTADGGRTGAADVGARAAVASASASRTDTDVRDLLIVQQVRRIDALEREIVALRAELGRG